jgi:hypothetical protein
VANLTFTNEGTAVTGTGFDSSLVGKYLRLEADAPETVNFIAAVPSATEITLAGPYAGSSGTGWGALGVTPTGVYPANTKIPLKGTKYKRMINILQEAIGSYPIIPKVGALPGEAELAIDAFRNISRGMRSPFQAIPFRYATLRSLNSEQGLEIRVNTMHHRVYGGEGAFLTFYCTSETP